MKIPYEKMEKLFEISKKTPYRVSKDLGYSKSLFPRWRDGISCPKYDKIQEIADYFGVDLIYFYGDIQSMTDERNSFMDEVDKETHKLAKKTLAEYYADPEVQMITQEIHDRPDMRGLFNAAKDLTPEQVKTAIAIIEAYAKEQDNED